jgi:nitrogen regulatory protein P-II 1
MKKLEAIISPFIVEEVQKILRQHGIKGMTLSDVKGSVADEAPVLGVYRGTRYVVDEQPKIKIEVVLDDELAARAAEIIGAKADSERGGRASILVLPVDEVIRIRTGQRGGEAV